MVDATSMLFLRLRVQDRRRLRAHFLRLSPEDRRLRFGGAGLSDLALARYCDRIDWSQKLLVGCQVGEQLCGVGELHPLEQGGVTGAEIAITVERQFQGRGIGRRLFRRLMTLASNRGIRRLYLICAAENDRMQRIARHYGTDLIQHQNGVEGELTPPWPSGASIAEEWLDESLAAWRMLLAPPRRAA